MKRTLEHNLLLCLSGLFVFWICQITYTTLKVSKYHIVCPEIYFFGAAIGFVLIALGLMYIAYENKKIREAFTFFVYLAVGNLGDEITFTAMNFDRKEYWFTAAFFGFFIVKILKKK